MLFVVVVRIAKVTILIYKTPFIFKKVGIHGHSLSEKV